jgi:hypothetical protein
VIAASRDASAAALAQIAETKIEKTPPEPGFLRSGEEKIALTLVKANGTLEMMFENSLLAFSERRPTAR